MNSDIDSEIWKFHRSLQGENSLPLEPDDDLYVPILQQNPQRDPVLQLFLRINSAESESVHLLTGFRGNGKSTELKRLRKLLRDLGHTVILVNMADYILMTKPLEIGDFLLSVVAAFADQVKKESGVDALSQNALVRFWQFLSETEVHLESMEGGVEAGGISTKFMVRLSRDPVFKKEVQEKLRTHLGGLLQQTEEFIREVVDKLKKNDPEHKVILLVDSSEHIRGFGDDRRQVLDSVVELFSGQAINVALPMLHVVYTVPPFLISKAPNLSINLGGNPISMWPNIHVKKRSGEEDSAGLETMRTIIQKRYENWAAFYTQQQLDRLAIISGGDIRDFFRLVREGILGLGTSRLTLGDTKPERIDDDMIEHAIAQLRTEFQPIPRNDLIYLKQIHETNDNLLTDIEELDTLMRFLDSNMIMNYLNGDQWYDIHPILMEIIRSQLKEES